jgi:hypothetical protein
MAKGPNFIADLVKVLIQFRLHPIALTMDVKEMFLQVEMAPQSRRYHRFVFQWPHKDDITEYQFTRHPFGSTGSPCIAMHIVRERAIQMRDQYPAAANLILNYSIIDDAMTSAPTVEDAKAIYNGVKAILSACTMEVHKIASNSDEVLTGIPPSERAKGFDANTFLQDTCPTTYTLGMLWRSATDLYSFESRIIPPAATTTMRYILKHTASIFDPIGLISPFIVQARLIVQDCFQAKLGWDDPGPRDVTRAVEIIHGRGRELVVIHFTTMSPAQASPELHPCVLRRLSQGLRRGSLLRVRDRRDDDLYTHHVKDQSGPP